MKAPDRLDFDAYASRRAHASREPVPFGRGQIQPMPLGARNWTIRDEKRLHEFLRNSRTHKQCANAIRAAKRV